MQKQQLPLLLLPPNITSILYVTKSVQNPRIKKKKLFSKKYEFIHSYYIIHIFIISLLTYEKNSLGWHRCADRGWGTIFPLSQMASAQPGLGPTLDSHSTLGLFQ